MASAATTISPILLAAQQRIAANPTHAPATTVVRQPQPQQQQQPAPQQSEVTPTTTDQPAAQQPAITTGTTTDQSATQPVSVTQPQPQPQPQQQGITATFHTGTTTWVNLKCLVCGVGSLSNENDVYNHYISNHCFDSIPMVSTQILDQQDLTTCPHCNQLFKRGLVHATTKCRIQS